MVNSRLASSEVAKLHGGKKIAQLVYHRGDIWSWGGQYILFRRTGFLRKMCPPGHNFQANRFSSDARIPCYSGLLS